MNSKSNPPNKDTPKTDTPIPKPNDFTSVPSNLDNAATIPFNVEGGKKGKGRHRVQKEKQRKRKTTRNQSLYRSKILQKRIQRADR